MRMTKDIIMNNLKFKMYTINLVKNIILNKIRIAKDTIMNNLKFKIYIINLAKNIILKNQLKLMKIVMNIFKKNKIPFKI